MITDYEILECAYKGALDIWNREFEIVNRNPKDRYAKAREKKAWQKVKQIEERLKKFENSVDF